MPGFFVIFASTFFKHIKSPIIMRKILFSIFVIAFTLSAMGHLFSGMLNVTLNYPDNEEPAKDMLLGKMKRIQVKVELLEVTEEQTGDYFNDEEYKAKFQSWLNELWQKKDKLLGQLNS